MAISDVPKVPRDGTMAWVDNGTEGTFTLDYEVGNVSFDSGRAERVVVRDRGIPRAVRKGDEPVIVITCDVAFRQFTNGSANCVIDVFEYTGNYSSGVSTTNIKGDFKFGTVTFTKEGTNLGDSADHTITFLGCVGMWAYAEGKPDTLTLTIESYGGAAGAKPVRTGPA